MNVFRRLSDIISSNVNSALDRIEDPKKMIPYMIREVEDTLNRTKSSLMQREAERKSLAMQIESYQSSYDRWAQRAQAAAKAEKMDLAREALVEKKDIAEKIKASQSSLDTMDRIIMSTEEQVSQLQDRLDDMKLRQGELLSRAEHAKRTRKAQTVIKKAEDNDLFSRFSELEEKIEKMEAENSLHKPSSAEDRFRDMEIDSEIEKELEELKKNSN